MIRGSLLNGRVAQLAIVGAAFIALSGLPAYADSGGYYQQYNPSYGTNYRNSSCQDARGYWNYNQCQNDRGYQNGGRYQTGGRYQNGGQYYNGGRYQNGGGYQNTNRYQGPQYRQPQRPPYYQQQWCQNRDRNNCQQPSQYPQDQRTHDDGNSK